MYDLIRDAPLGQALRLLSGHRLFRYPEERPDFILPALYAKELNGEKSSYNPSNELDGISISKTKSRAETLPYSNERFEIEQQLSVERTQSLPIAPQTTSDGIILVDWYTSDDPANPQNWSITKRRSIVFLMCAYTWVVYTGSAIYVASEGGIMERFNVGPTAASLPLALYVLAYGLGPLVFAPLSEIPVIGRNPVYIWTFILFFALSIPTAVVDNFAGLLVLRFLQGLFGSPALANGGATFSDMYGLLYLPYPLSWWVWSAWAGPALGPLMAGFAVTAQNWHWSLWEIVWMAAPMLVVLLAFMPETSASNILLHRAKRLRHLTTNSRLQSQSEIDQRNLNPREIAVHALIKPIEITIKDPAIFFVNIYTALFYGIYYTFFEVFPLVFPPMYSFNLGETGLAFLPCLLGASIGVAIYFSYLHWYMIPDNLKHGLRAQEHRLVPAIFGSVLVPTGLFIFAWCADPHIHWVVPIIGIVIFVIGTFLILQSIFVYVPLSYPQYAASLFAGNDLTRSSVAAGSILYARPLFVNLGVDKGVTVLASLAILGIAGMIVLYYKGAKLRARSKFAQN